MNIKTIILASGVLLASAACSDEADGKSDFAATQAGVNAHTGAQITAAGLQSGPGVAAAAAKGLPQGAIRVERAKIIDAQGFEKPMTAATMLIPAGWKTQGGIGWNPQISDCGPIPTHINWAAVAPDGVSQLQILPELKFTGMQANMAPPPQTQCPNMMITDATEFFRQYVGMVRSGAQIIDMRPRQDLKQQMEAMLQPQMSPGMGMEVRQWVDAVDLLLAYSVNGQDVREIMTTGAVFFYTAIPDAMGGRMESLLTSTMPTFALRAPNGQLNFKHAEMFRNSYMRDPQWGARMAKHNAVIARQNAQGAAARSRIITETNNEIMDMQQDSWRRQNEMRDRGQRETTEMILGVETYNDPYNGGTVQLDNTYDNAWQLNDGTFVLTDDPSFEPNVYLGVDGQKLQPTP
ncbi:MAG: hypothetical protein AAGB02_02630 [Pseudomonadota bacterium]